MMKRAERGEVDHPHLPPLRPDDPVPADLWDHLQRVSLRCPEGSPARLIAAEPRPTFGEFAAKIDLYAKLLRMSR